MMELAFDPGPEAFNGVRVDSSVFGVNKLPGMIDGIVIEESGMRIIPAPFIREDNKTFFNMLPNFCRENRF